MYRLLNENVPFNWARNKLKDSLPFTSNSLADADMRISAGVITVSRAQKNKITTVLLPFICLTVFGYFPFKVSWSV